MTHIETVLTGSIPSKYQLQILWQLACSGRSWCDFVSYDPRLPERLRLSVQRLPRDESRIAELEEEVSLFLAELDATLSRLLRVGRAA
jgi:hypothetical protein